MGAVRIGVIGAGKMGERHCRVCANLPRVELVGLSDLDPQRGHLVADWYDTGYFADRQALLSQVDAVTIAAPTQVHHSLAVECLQQGLHVMVEKPIAETIEQARQLVTLAEERELVLQVGHIERFNPAYIELKHVTEDLSIVGVSMRRLSPFDTSNVDVDVIRDLMIHDLDLAVDLMGVEPDGIVAWGRSIHTGAIDHAVTTLSFQGGPIATLFASRVTEHKVRAVEVIADGAYIEADLLNKTILVHRRTFPQYLDNHHTTKYRQESVIERIHVPMSEPLMLELRHFTTCVREGRRSDVSGHDGLRALELTERVVRSLNGGS
jgi:predicted dehydrogenase